MQRREKIRGKREFEFVSRVCVRVRVSCILPRLRGNGEGGGKFLKLIFLKLDMLISGIAFFTLNSLTNFRILPRQLISNERFFVNRFLARTSVATPVCDSHKYFTCLVVKKPFSIVIFKPICSNSATMYI